MPCWELFLLIAKYGRGMAVSKDRSQSHPATWRLGCPGATGLSVPEKHG